MADYKHHVSGFFVKREEAQIAQGQLLAGGLPEAQLHIYDNSTAQIASNPEADSNGALKNMVVDGTVGVAVGTGLGVLAEVGLVLANVSVFVASPLIAPLLLLGWGAGMGGVIGAVVGSDSQKKKEGKLADMVQDAIMTGQVVLVAETRSKEETRLAQEVMDRAVGGFKDVSTVQPAALA